MKLGRPRLINHYDPVRSFASKIEQGAALFAAGKGLYDVGRAIYSVGTTIAPYVVGASRVIAGI